MRAIRQQGFSLIESVIFIIVISIILLGLFLSFNEVLVGATQPAGSSIANDLARQRMELILGRKRIAGYLSFTDPCDGGGAPAICTPPGGYTVTRTAPATLPLTTGDQTTITVAVDGPASNDASLSTIVGNY